MATPEQNTLLALQLFGAPAAQLNQQNDTRTNLAFKLAQLQREEQLKRDIAAMTIDRDDTRQLGAERRQTAQLNALQTREDTRATESERRQTAALDARDKQQVTAEMNRLYPQYAQAAARAGKTIKQRKDYPETNEGLGQLAADAKTAEVGIEEKKLKGAATALVGGLDEAVTAVDTIKSRIADLSKPLPQELKVARGQAVKALGTAIENKQLASTEKLRPAAIKKGLAHLAAGEDALARELLGAEAFTAFENQIEAVLLGLDSRKSAMQERSQLNQQLLQLQSQVARTNSDVMKAAGGNPFLADELATRRTAIQQLMAPIVEPRRQRSFEEVTPALGATATPTVTPQTPLAGNPALDAYRAEQATAQRQSGFQGLLELARMRDESRTNVGDLSSRLTTSTPQFVGGMGATSAFPVDERGGLATALQAALAEQRQRETQYDTAARGFARPLQLIQQPPGW